MRSIVFLPGILGSRMELAGEEVWPPSPWEAQFGYQRLAELMQDDVVAGPPIDRVWCYGVYRKLLQDLERIASGSLGGQAGTFHPIGYDWRVSIVQSANTVADRLDEICDEERSPIALVAHSMGCLVARYLLERPEFGHRPFKTQVKSLTALAGPHRGAVTALVRAAGKEGSTGLSPEDIRLMSSDHRFPSLYQLLPHRQMAAVWEARGHDTEVADLFEASVVERLGLDPDNIQAAHEFHRNLNEGRRPEGVDYLFLAGSGHDTWSRVELRGNGIRPVKSGESGDGTVPLWSAIEPMSTHHAAPGVHQFVAQNPEIRLLMHRTLGVNLPGEPWNAEDGKPRLQTFCPEPIYEHGGTVVVQLQPLNPARSVRGTIELDYTEDPTTEDFDGVLQMPLTYDGEELEQLKVRIRPPKPGFYRVRFTGSHTCSSEDAAMFGVSELDAGRIH